MESEFSSIYANSAWNRKYRSGPGSDPAQVGGYVEILQEILNEEKVGSVVDLGCGDWSFSSGVDWTGVDYTGVEVVPEVVDELNCRHARPGIRFIQGDLTTMALPPADMAILEDVLQHWPTRKVLELLPRLTQYPIVIFTNDARIVRRGLWPPFRETDIAPPNSDTTVGGYRPLRLNEPPFTLDGEECARFTVREGRIRFFKEVILLRHLMRPRHP